MGGAILSTLDTLRQRGHTLSLRPDGKVFHRRPAGATDEIREHLEEIRAELLAEAAAATADGNPAIAPDREQTAAQIDEPGALGEPDAPERPRRWRAGTRRAERWTDETHELIAWFRTTLPPDEPFDTPGGLTVSTPRRYWAFLADWIADGAASPHPGLTANLRQLRTIWEERHG